MPSDEPRISISAQAETLSILAKKMDKIKEQANMLASQIGLLSQEYYILNEAMRITLKDMNGGVEPLPCPNRLFPALNHPDDY